MSLGVLSVLKAGSGFRCTVKYLDEFVMMQLMSPVCQILLRLLLHIVSHSSQRLWEEDDIVPALR